MRVFISSTPDELKPHRQAAADVVRELGYEPVQRDPNGRRGLDPLTACGRQVALTDALLAIVGWRRGPVPTAALGGDGLRPWCYWETQSAFEHGVPVVALLASETFAPELREEVPETRAMVLDFRGELTRLAATFRDETEVRRLTHTSLHAVQPPPPPSDTMPAGLKLRRFRPPELPAQPYPLLLPYTHPALLAGRDDDLAALRRALNRRVTIVGLHAASGTGKSSLLAGALVPVLRAEGRPVAFVRHPAEAGLAARLLGDLVETEHEPPGPSGASADTITGFVDRLAAVRNLAGGRTPVLVIDQFEDVLKDSAATARADLGTLLAASAQRLPGTGGPACRWLLAYRQEYHGKLVEWLEDVLREARDAGRDNIDRLPHDLSEPSRFVARPLRPLATPPAAADDPLGATARVFQDVIERPLSLGGYPWTFAPGHAERLAHAFAEARIRRPDAPLVPELQVVLAHLLEQAGEPLGSETVTVEVPEEPEELIDRALEDHLRRALDLAFPQTLVAGGDAAARIARTRALLVLRELADVHGRREQGRGADALARALGEQGREVLEKLSTPRTRLVLLERRADAWVYVLAHDRLAEVLVKVVDEGAWAGFGVDAELLGLRRFVALQIQLHASGDSEQATTVPARYFSKVEANQEVLFWTESQWAWWRACLKRRCLERRRRLTRRTTAVMLVALVATGAWTTADRRARRQALLDDVATGESAAAFAALDRLTLEKSNDQQQLLTRLRERAEPFDIFEHGLGGVDEERRAEVLLRVAELALPILEASPEDPMLIASLVWALDFFVARHVPSPITPPRGADRASVDLQSSQWQGERAAALRDKVLGPLRGSRPPPPRPADNNPQWADIPAGTFWMGADPDEGADETFILHSRPRHQVALSAFRIMTHEVTNAEYRRLFHHHPGVDDLPAVSVSWYHAYTYAAWLGGRLPTEAEWEYAARAGCGHAFCRPDGSEATLDQVAWWGNNSVDPMTGEPAVQPIMQLTANPWGLFDMFGNAMEWNANWFGAYSGTLEADPAGPTEFSLDHRTLRGGSVWQTQITPSRRFVDAPHAPIWSYGLRVVTVE